jgi:nucleotide-binding universal stress UspA family protein
VFDGLLVPTDGSEQSAAATTAAVALAVRFDATVHAVHVVDADELPLSADEAMVGGLVAHGERLTRAVADRAAEAGVDAVTAVVEDGRLPHHAVVDYAADHDIDLVVMGTHGRTGLDRFVLGSVAEWTLRRSPVPVVTLHAGARLDPDLDTVVLPTDGSAHAEAAAGHAVRLAAATGATLHVVTVVDLGVVWEDEDAGQVADVLARSGGRAVGQAVDRAREAGVERVESAVLRGTPYRAVVDYAADHDADLVVVGTRGRTGLDRYLLGSVAERVVRASDVPVFAVPARREAGD